MFALVNLVIQIVLGVIDSLMGTGGVTSLPGPYGGVFYQSGLLANIFSLIVLIPSIAVAARRLHDTDRSPWWLLLALIPVIGWIVLIVFFAQAGTRGENRYGADPLAHESIAA